MILQSGFLFSCSSDDQIFMRSEAYANVKQFFTFQSSIQRARSLLDWSDR